MERDQSTEMIPMPAVGEFEVVLRGYDRAQVRETVERLEGDVRVALTDRDAAVARSSDLASQLSAVHAEMESLRRKLSTAAAPSFETMGERISKMLRLAEEEAAELRREAQTDANATRGQVAVLHKDAAALQQQAQVRATAVRDKAAADAAALTDHAAQAAAARVAAAEKRAAEIIAAAESTRDRMLAQTKERTSKAENDFEIALRGRRAEFARADSERERSSTAEAKRRVEEATVQAAQRVAEAAAQGRATVASAEQHSAEIRTRAEAEKRQVDELRARALAQLYEVRALLQDLPPQTPPTPGVVPVEVDPAEAGPAQGDPPHTQSAPTAGAAPSA